MGTWLVPASSLPGFDLPNLLRWLIMIIMSSKPWKPLLLTVALLLVFAGCSPATSSPDTGSAGAQGTTVAQSIVVASIYPFQYLASRIAGDKVAIQTLTPAGSDAHSYEMTPRQIAAVSKADLVIYQKGFQAATDKAMQQVKPKRVIETGTLVTLLPADATLDDGDDHGSPDPGSDSSSKGGYGNDPHIWLDPVNASKVASAVADQLISIDPANSETYRANAAALAADLTSLDAEFRTGLANCQRIDFITSHAAFGYLAKAYGLHQLSIAGITPEDEPSPARLAQLQALAREHGVTTIFYETLVSPDLSNTLARDLGLKTDVLDPVAGLSPQAKGTDYLSIMRANLAALRAANGCQ